MRVATAATASRSSAVVASSLPAVGGTAGTARARASARTRRRGRCGGRRGRRRARRGRRRAPASAVGACAVRAGGLGRAAGATRRPGDLGRRSSPVAVDEQLVAGGRSRPRGRRAARRRSATCAPSAWTVWATSMASVATSTAPARAAVDLGRGRATRATAMSALPPSRALADDGDHGAHAQGERRDHAHPGRGGPGWAAARAPAQGAPQRAGHSLGRPRQRNLVTHA